MHTTDYLISRADLSDPADVADTVRAVSEYALDPMGGGKPLPDAVKNAMGEGLKNHPGTVVMLARSGNELIGGAICFIGFSTFRAKPLLNIHDIFVLPQWRGSGVGAALLEHVAAEAQAAGCCKVTLEVRDDNPAQHLYQRAGFKDGDAPMRFLTRDLDAPV